MNLLFSHKTTTISLVFLCIQLYFFVAEASATENGPAETISSDKEQVAAVCGSDTRVISYKSIQVLCLIGLLTEIPPEVQAGDFDVVFVYSGGGDAKLAMEIGKVVHTRKTPLVVYKFCLSSCANYIVPAAHKIYIVENSFIGLHGTPPRDFKKIEDSIITDMARRGGFDDFAQLQHASMESLKDETLRLIHSEVDFYLSIGVNELYATSYHYNLIKTQRLASTNPCRAPHNIFHIIGPEHLNAFGINVVQAWYPTTREDFEIFIRYFPNYSYMYDMEDRIFYNQFEGFIGTEYCKDRTVSVDKNFKNE